jgi:hypothetical protein
VGLSRDTLSFHALRVAISVGISQDENIGVDKWEHFVMGLPKVREKNVKKRKSRQKICKVIFEGAFDDSILSLLCFWS